MKIQTECTTGMVVEDVRVFAMQAGIADHLMTYEDLIGIMDEWEIRERLA